MGSDGIIKRLGLDRDYDQITWLRSALVIAPSFGIGSAIDVALSSEVSRKRDERLNSFLDWLKQEISSTQDTSLDATFFRSDEGIDLIVGAIEKSVRTRQKEKHSLFAKIVVKASVSTDYQEEDPEIFMAIIDELPVRYFELLNDYHSIVMSKNLHGKDLIHRYMATETCNAQASTLLQLAFPVKYKGVGGDLARIAASGLIKEKTGSGIGYGGGAYTFTDLYVRFRKFLEAKNDGESSNPDSSTDK